MSDDLEDDLREEEACAPVPRRTRFWRGCLFGLVIAWTVGFLLFVADVQTHVEPLTDDAIPISDAIVVLTGGSERIDAGVKLLASGKGRKLLISGVGHGVKINHLLSNQNLPNDVRECCLILGREADNTFGNAEETRDWIKREGFKSITLVTAHYHMPRALLFFRKNLPGISITPYAVTPDNVRLDDWWTRWGTAHLLLTEYNKYLFALLRIL